MKRTYKLVNHGLDKLIGDIHSIKGRILMHIPQQIVLWVSLGWISRSSRKGGERQHVTGTPWGQIYMKYVQFFKIYFSGEIQASRVSRSQE